MICLYAIGERDDRLVAFTRRGAAQPPTEAALVEHDRIVFSLMSDGAVLPMRFGAVLPDEDAVRGMLRERSEELRAGLERVRGRVEIGVRAGWEQGSEEGAGPDRSRSGAEFMRAKLERRRAARSRADEIHPRLAELAADSVLTLCPRDDTAFTAAYLVDRNDIERFAARANTVTVTGPWPPYSFSG